MSVGRKLQSVVANLLVKEGEVLSWSVFVSVICCEQGKGECPLRASASTGVSVEKKIRCPHEWH